MVSKSIKSRFRATRTHRRLPFRSRLLPYSHPARITSFPAFNAWHAALEYYYFSYFLFRSAQLNGLYADTMNSLPVLKSIHLNCAQHLGNAQLGSLGNSSQPGISTYGQVSILIVCLSMSHVITAQMPFGLYSLFGSIARRVILSKHLPGCATKSRGGERERARKRKLINCFITHVISMQMRYINVCIYVNMVYIYVCVCVQALIDCIVIYYGCPIAFVAVAAG